MVADTPVTVGILEPGRLLKDYEAISPRLKSLMSSLITRLSNTTEKAVNMTIGDQ